MAFNRLSGNEVASAIDARIQKVAQEVFTNSPTNRTAYGRVVSQKGGYFTVNINSHTYTNVVAIRSVGQIKNNETVVCLIPNNEYSNILILGVADGTLVSNSGESGSGGIVSAVNGSTGPTSIYAPTTSGTAGQYLVSQGANNAPIWQTISLDDYLTNVSYSSAKLQQTKNGITSDIVALGLTTTTGSESATIGSNTLNLLTRDTVQTISGAKTLGAPLKVTGGDGVSAGKISMSNSSAGQITDDSTATLFGFLSNNATTLTVGGNSYGLNLRGSATRPTYKGSDLALYSDIPTNYVRYDTNAQGLNSTNQGNARTNIDAQQTISSSNKLSADLIADGTTNKAYTATEQTKLSGIASGAQVNVLESVKSGTTTFSISSKAVDIQGVDNLTNYYTKTDTYSKTEVDGIVSSVYKPAGSVAFASLPTLASGVLGNVYSVTDSFTIDNRFVEYSSGSTKTYPAGTNVVVVNTGTSESLTYMFDVLAGFVDLSGYVPTSRKVNNKALSSDITLSASDVGAEPTISTKNTAFNKNFETSTSNIKMNGSVSVGSADTVARADHIHPSDTSKLSLTGGDLTGDLNIKSGNNTVLTLDTNGDVNGRYLKGNWLFTSNATELNNPSKVAVLDTSGWVYYRSMTNLKNDLGVPAISSTQVSITEED